MSQNRDYPKKYWWVILVVVPIVLAIIAGVFALLGNSGSGAGGGNKTTIKGDVSAGGDLNLVTGDNNLIFTGPVNAELSDKQLELKFEVAYANVAQNSFVQAIIILEEIAAKTPSAAVYNNLVLFQQSNA